jgi:D-serine deaminase-like pyridoxal phosphate-dependent protein
MDTAYTGAGLPFRQALTVLATVISVTDHIGSLPGWAVADVGLKALGMDHGNPAVAGGQVWFVSDEHLTFTPHVPARVGDRVLVWPAHIDPTVAYHDRMHLADGSGVDANVVDSWPVDLRGWDPSLLT